EQAAAPPRSRAPRALPDRRPAPTAEASDRSRRAPLRPGVRRGCGTSARPPRRYGDRGSRRRCRSARANERNRGSAAHPAARTRTGENPPERVVARRSRDGYPSTVVPQLTRVVTPAELEPLRVSVVIPCLNEAENIVQCVSDARRVLDEHGIAG